MNDLVIRGLCILTGKDMSDIIALSGFVLDNNTGVYTPPAAETRVFRYSDGSENKLLSILENAIDRSSNSMELELAIDDWPTKYHLSNLRTNILRALDYLNKDSTVLEIGAGCGALTRYLGENFKEVDALEGESKRAYITKQRTKELGNVNVYWSALKDLEFDKEYDIVTLIGVLEYAPVYYAYPGKDKQEAALAMLKHTVRTLKENGILVLAIENRLGLKYWSGCGEEHTGTLYEGIHGYVRENTPITFSRSELIELLRKSQLNYLKFYYPFPDYKLSQTIIQEVKDPSLYYLHNWIPTPFEDYHGRREHHINELLTIKSLTKTGLFYEFSNSFLVVASKSYANCVTEGNTDEWIAKRFSTNRINPFKTTTTLKQKRNSSEVEICKEKMFNSQRSQENTQIVSLRISNSEWIPGELLELSFYEAIYGKDSRQLMKDIVRKYHDELMKNYSIGEKDREGYPLVSSDAIDFVPWNIIETPSGIIGFDQEWIFSRRLTSDYMLFRAIYLFLCKEYHLIWRRNYVPGGDIDKFAVSMIKEFYPMYDENRQNLNKTIEQELHYAVTGKQIRFPTPLDMMNEMCPSREKELQINSLLNSWSWKITSPLRWVYKIMSGNWK